MKTKDPILAANARFNALPPMEKRLAIARDILSQLKAGAFIAGSGYGSEHQRWFLPLGDLQKNLNDGVVCDGCAKAAILISKARLGNEVIVDDDFYGLNKMLAQEVSRAFFGVKCADVIEALYEGNAGYCVFDVSTPEYFAIEKYIDRLPDGILDRERMERIYKNIVRNKGYLKIGEYKF